MGHQGGRPDSKRDFLRTLSILLVVLAVLYSGLLLFLISGPAMEDVEGLRKLAFVVLVLAIVASGGLIFLGLPMFSIGSADEPLEAAAAPPAMDVEEPSRPRARRRRLRGSGEGEPDAEGAEEEWE